MNFKLIHKHLKYAYGNLGGFSLCRILEIYVTCKVKQSEQQRQSSSMWTVPCTQCILIYICESVEGRREGGNEERLKVKSQYNSLQPPKISFCKITFASLSASEIYKCLTFSSLTAEVLLIHEMHFQANQLNTFISTSIILL